MSSDVQSPQGEQTQTQQPVQLNFDESKMVMVYSNLCRVMGAAEEIVVDLAYNPQSPYGIAGQPITVSHRVVMNYYAAKRMLQTLAMTIQHHEQIFGVLETDVNRRIRPGVVAQPPQG